MPPLGARCLEGADKLLACGGHEAQLVAVHLLGIAVRTEAVEWVVLNEERVPGPRGGLWQFSTIYGNRERGIGILNNELYVGRRVWNRQRFVKDPRTGKRQARLNDEADLVV